MNGQSSELGNIRQTRHRTKANKAKKTQISKQIGKTDQLKNGE